MFRQSSRDTAEYAHPTKSRELRFWRDTILRDHGFEIAARPKDGPTVWTRRGKRYTEDEAFALCKRDA